MGTQGPSVGHQQTKRWASTDQALGINRPSVGHLLPVRWAQSAQTSGDFWALLVRSVVLLLRMPHDVFAMLWWRFLWYFYHIYDTSMILLITQFKMYHSSILLHISYLFLYSVEKMILWYFFHKKTFSYTISTGWKPFSLIGRSNRTDRTNFYSHKCYAFWFKEKLCCAIPLPAILSVPYSP